MNDKSRDKDHTDVDATPEWHPFAVWQQRIRDAEPASLEGDQNVTGSWRTDAVWQNLIKG